MTKSGKVATVQVFPEKIELAGDKLGSATLFDELYRSMTRGADTLVYVHGYNVSFSEALETAARLKKKYSTKVRLSVVVYCWPSAGRMVPLLAYKRDRSDAVVSSFAFARGLLKLSDYLVSIRRAKECNASIHLMAHGMGVYLLRESLQELRRHIGALPQLFDQVFLMAADEDYDSLELDHKLRPAGEIGRGINIYFNTGDTALVASDRTKANSARLGTRGARLPLQIPGGFSLIDTSEVVSSIVGHSYFAYDESVITDVRAVMLGQRQELIRGRYHAASKNCFVMRRTPND